MIWLILILGGYLLGSIHFCRVLGLLICHVDICEKSYDKNPGAANAFWYCGKAVGIAGFLLDWLKGFLPVMLAVMYADIENPLFIAVMIAPVMGHAFSIFSKFSGGKCITTTFGVTSALMATGVNLYLFPIFLIADGFFSFVKKILPGNLRALVIYCILALSSIPICIYLGQINVLCGVIGISIIAVFKHLPIYDPRDENARARLAKRAAKRAKRKGKK